MRRSVKDVLRIGIAILLIMFCLLMTIIRDYPVTEFIVVVLFAFALALLSFLVVGKVSGSTELFKVNLKTVTGGFAVFVIIISGYFFYDDRLFEISKYEREIIEINDPSDVKIWEKPSGHFKWFNAPFSFAISSHFETKLEWFSKPDFRISALLIDSPDSLQHKLDFLPKLKRLRIFCDSLSKYGIDCQRRIEARIYLANNIPSTSFFIAKKSMSGRPYSIMYMSKSPKPDECLVSESETFERILNSEFQNYWDNETTKKISIALLMNKNLDITGPVTQYIQ